MKLYLKLIIYVLLNHVLTAVSWLIKKMDAIVLLVINVIMDTVGVVKDKKKI